MAALLCSGAEPLCNFGRGYHGEQFCEIILNLDQRLRRRCSLKYFHSYLTNRFQFVIPGGISEWLEMLTDVPQGSILGPFLFIMFINDIVK